MSDNQLARNAAIQSLDALMSASLDDLDDLPAFETPPPGVYLLTVSLDVKEVNKNDAVEAQFTVVETTELKDPAAKESPPGTKFSTLYTLNEFGIGKLKAFLALFAAHFGTTSISELVQDKVKDVTIVAQVKNRADKDDKERLYADVKVISIA